MTTTNHNIAAPIDVDRANAQLQGKSAQEVVQWAADTFRGRIVLTSSFGDKAAVMLHLVTQVIPDIPVIFIDTGYLFPETYQFAQQLAERLKLNMKVYQSAMTPARMEAIHGKLWENDTKESLDLYDRMRKVEPMQRAIEELEPAAWFAGLRKSQTDFRASLRYVELQGDIVKVHPILNWSGKDVHEYLKKHDLPYHPLVDKGYPSIGDWHSTASVTAGGDERSGRFRGLKQECGLHLPKSSEENESREGSGL